MAFEDTFEELDRMFLSKSTDYEKMRATLQAMREVFEIARASEAGLDNLYTSIARGHRKALVHLESGDTAAAMREMAGAVSWFLQRFQGVDPENPETMAKCPHIADELRAARELAERSKVLRDTLSQSHDIHAV